MLLFVIVLILRIKGKAVMLLSKLKYWREKRDYSLRKLAEKSKVPYSAISLLENLKREPQGRTVHKLAAALEVEVTDLYEQTASAIIQSVNINKPITPAKPARSNRTRASKQPTVPALNWWVIDQEGDIIFGPFRQSDAERLQEKLGGHHQARVYEATSRSEASKQHNQFLIKVARGHDYW